MNDPHLALALAIAVLGLGPLLAWALSGRESLRAALDGFVLVMVGGLSLLFLLPHAYAGLGLWAFPAALLGLLLPSVGERLLRSSHAGASSAILALAVVGLLLHSAIDGAALALAGHGAGEPGQLEVTLAIVGHRLPVGLFVWSVVSPVSGRGWAFSALAALMVATASGFALSPSLVAFAGEGALTPAVVAALLAGGLLHVIIDHGPQCEDAQFHKGAAGAGALLAAGLFCLLPLEPLPVLEKSWSAGTRLFAETSPAILIGFLGAGLLSLVPQDTLRRWMRGKTALGSAARGVLFGLPIPICSCGVVPLYRGLMRKGLPPAAAVAFLIATPELGIDTVAISLPLLGWELTLMRIAAATILALCAGLAIAALTRDAAPTSSEGEQTAESDPGAGRVRRALRFGFVESLDELGPWIVAGIALAALLDPLLDPAWIAAVPRAAEIPLFASLSAPIYVCASAATPIGAAFLVKGATAGAVIAFLLVGPATNVTTYGAVRAFHALRTTLAMGAVILGTTLLLGLAVNLLGGTRVANTSAPLHEPGMYAQLAAWVFCALLVISILRQGPRGFLAQLGIRGHGHAHPVSEHAHTSRNPNPEPPSGAPTRARV